MRMSKLFLQTRREAPAEAEIASHQLLLRAGYIRQLGAGIFTSMPLGHRAITKIANIMRDEINAIGGQEITMPVVHPADIWKETGRWYQIGSEMGRFLDKNDHDMVLGMTHEEVVADLVRNEIHSYRQLPALVYQIQTKWRDDPRPRAGLIRAREFEMLDSYSLDASWEGLDEIYQAHYQAYFNIFNRCKLPTVAVESDTGMMGGQMAHEYMYLSPIGEDTLLFCDGCGYSANRQIAGFNKGTPAAETMLPIEKVATPHTTTIEDLARLLNIPASRTAKAVFLMAEKADDSGEQFVFVVVRGDMEVNETKLSNAIKARSLRPATEAEIRATGAVPGYASPVGLKDVLVIVDDLIPHSPNLVAGANEDGYHLLNTNYGRDYTGALVADIVSASEGSACPQCGHAMRISRGVEVGNIFKLGTRYTKALGCTFHDENGQEQPVIMGSYGIGLGRLLACVAQEHHDERGLIMPVSIAPYPVHMVLLGGKAGQNSGEAQAVADQLYTRLTAAGLEPLLDERPESPGVKFMDADLIGLPVRVTIGERSLKNGGVELKARSEEQITTVPVEQAVDEIKAMLERLA